MTSLESEIRTFVANLSTPADIELLKVVADERLARLRDIDGLRARFQEQAASVGLTAEAVINGPVKRTRRGRPRKSESISPEE